MRRTRKTFGRLSWMLIIRTARARARGVRIRWLGMTPSIDNLSKSFQVKWSDHNIQVWSDRSSRESSVRSRKASCSRGGRERERPPKQEPDEDIHAEGVGGEQRQGVKRIVDVLRGPSIFDPVYREGTDPSRVVNPMPSGDDTETTAEVGPSQITAGRSGRCRTKGS